MTSDDARITDPDSDLIIGYEEDGVLWLTACSKWPDADAAARQLSGRPGDWRPVAEVFVKPELAPNGMPYGGGDESWIEGEADAPFARSAWRCVDVAEPMIVFEGEEMPNPHYEAGAASRDETRSS